jgi:branched-chain amino acid transport system ATP-binding protein
VSLLRVAGLRKHFGGVRAVDGVGFELGASERVALIGPNGAGKSTCFNLLNGQLRPDAGSIRLADRELVGLPPRAIWRLGVGRTFQITATFGSMTVLENLQLALLSRHRQLWRPWRRAARYHREPALALLEQVGMAEQADRSCAILAYGDLKRVELAMALANAPRLLLLDEPTAGMAPTERHALMDQVSDIARQRQLAVLFTEHDMDVVFQHADRLLVLDRGTLIAAGTPEAVRRDPQVQAVYLGEAA